MVGLEKVKSQFQNRRVLSGGGKMGFPILAILLTSYLIRAGAFVQLSGESYPTFPPLPGKADVWELGNKPNWPELRRRLAPFTNGSFYVTDETSEKHLANIRKRLDMYPSSSSTCWTLLHHLIGNRGGDDEQLIHQLLSMGVDPDLPKLDISWRPSHFTGGYARVAAAKALVLCRVNHTSLNSERKTPITAASSTYDANFMTSVGLNETELREIRPLVHEIWLNAKKNPTPSVAEMASHKQWFAVQNLCRRRVIPATEAFKEFNGKTAYEYAVHHQEYGLADELSYLLATGSETGHLKKALAAGDEEMKKYFDSRLEAHNEQLWNKLQKLIEEKFQVVNATFVQAVVGGQLRAGSQLDDNRTMEP